MGKAGELTVEVKLDVPKETVAACLAILNMYLKDNPNLGVVGEANKIDGYTQIGIYDRLATTE